MPRKTTRHVLLVDDEPAVRRAVRTTLQRTGLHVTPFESAQKCLEHIQDGNGHLVITDVRMKGMDGMELLTRIRCVAPWLPVIVMTGYGDIPMAVRALKAGAADFLEKPFDRARLIAVVNAALKRPDPPDNLVGEPLTQTEHKILRLVLEGRSSRDIAEILHRSTRTVEVHRDHLMRKLGAENLVQLVKHAVLIGLADLTSPE